MRYLVLKEGRFGDHKYSVRDMDSGDTVVIYDTRKAAEGHAATLNRPERMRVFTQTSWTCTAVELEA
jgi:hypothetical protein